MITGTRIKNYVLQGPVGRGAAGEVWRALDGGREVAIKFVNLGDDSHKYLESIKAEVKALQKLQHPHIPRLYDADLRGERPYLVMQHVGGLTYDRLIASGELFHVPVEKRLKALAAIASAVTAAHQRGILHRDIKPANISGIETPYLLDFGIALEDWHSSRAHMSVGTAIYMPPEDQADALSDHYSFALTAYEVLFGRHPIFTPNNIGKTLAETRRLADERLRRGEWRWPSVVPLPELPGDLYGANFAQLDAIFVRAFGPREQRYSDLAVFMADLRAAILTPGNQSYRPAPPLVLPPAIPADAAYTADEVAIERQATDHGSGQTPAKKPRNWLLFASTVGLVIWFAVIVLLVLLYRG